jgi:ribosomal protein L10
VSLTQTQKKGMEHKKKMVEDIRACLDEYKYVWIFSVGDMRTDGLQEVRNLWKGTGRIIYGKNKVVAKALGETEETEYKTGLSEIAKVSRDLEVEWIMHTSLTFPLIARIATERTPWTLPHLVGPKRDY